MPITAGIYYQTYHSADQDRAPIVLIHGAGGTHLHWSPEIRRLRIRTVYALDLPGHGKSPGPAKRKISAYANCIRDWMTAIEVKRAIIVGHSMGGAIALNLALEHPTVVAGLGLVSTGARLRVHPTIMELTAVPETFAEGIEQISAWSFGPRADPRLVELAAKRMLETPQHVFQADFAACDVFDVRERLSEIRTATLVICGSEDRMTPVRFAQSLAEHISGAALTILPEAGHMAILEQPQAILGAFKNFLSNR